MKVAIVLLAAIWLAGCGTPDPNEAAEGTLVNLGDVSSAHVADREVQVWLPPGYGDADRRYPVIYAHDGQNLFEPGRSYTGDEWTFDETMDRLIADGATRPAIVVGIANTGETRWAEYAPQKVVTRWPAERRAELVDPYRDLTGDAYLRFLVEELKPRIDRDYRTLTGPGDTFTIGSSMGGLISLYALTQYPDTFGAAAGLSIHWPIGAPDDDDLSDGTSPSLRAMQSYLDDHPVDPSRQRVWFDRGTETLDAHYGPYADAMSAYFEAAHPDAGDRIVFRVYPGTAHDEAAWAARLGDPLRFLLGEETAE